MSSWPSPQAARYILDQQVEANRHRVRHAATLADTLARQVPRGNLGLGVPPLGSPAVAHVALRRYLRKTGGTRRA